MCSIKANIVIKLYLQHCGPLHSTPLTQRNDDPVSSKRFILCGGVPILKSAVYITWIYIQKDYHISCNEANIINNI